MYQVRKQAVGVTHSITPSADFQRIHRRFKSRALDRHDVNEPTLYRSELNDDDGNGRRGKETAGDRYYRDTSRPPFLALVEPGDSSLD